MSQPVIAQKAPFRIEVQEGKVYFWCACGRSANQPFCDGSHKGSGFEPLRWKADRTESVFLCGCKHTANRPFCDGSHKNL